MRRPKRRTPTSRRDHVCDLEQGRPTPGPATKVYKRGSRCSALNTPQISEAMGRTPLLMISLSLRVRSEVLFAFTAAKETPVLFPMLCSSGRTARRGGALSRVFPYYTYRPTLGEAPGLGRRLTGHMYIIPTNTPGLRPLRIRLISQIYTYSSHIASPAYSALTIRILHTPSRKR